MYYITPHVMSRVSLAIPIPDGAAGLNIESGKREKEERSGNSNPLLPDGAVSVLLALTE
jgi:hypothetical protein